MASTPEQQQLDEMIKLRRWVVEHRERCWPEREDVEPSEIMPDPRWFETIHIAPSKTAFIICRRCGQRRHVGNGESDAD